MGRRKKSDSELAQEKKAKDRAASYEKRKSKKSDESEPPKSNDRIRITYFYQNKDNSGWELCEYRQELNEDGKPISIWSK
jgi:hypothetical protein